jgi:thymidylate synthase ThyX
LYAFARAYNLRSSPDAQSEIRDLAKEWDTIISKLFPYSWSCLTKGEN